MSRKTRRLAFFFAGMIGLCAAIVYFAPLATGTMIEENHEKEWLSNSLSACKPDEIVFIVFHGMNESATFNFTTKTLTGNDSEGLTLNGVSFGPPSRPIFDNIFFGQGVNYTDDDIAKIKSLLAAMPEPIVPTVGTISYRDRLHLAFYRDGHRVIYHYPKFTAPPQLADLCKALKIPEHAE